MKSPFTRFRTSVSLSCLVALAALTGPAQAFEPSGNEIADSFLTLLEAEEGTVESYANVSESGDVVTIDQIVLKDDDEDDIQVTLAMTEMTGAQKLDNGRLKLDALKISDLSMRAKDGALDIETFSATNLVLPSPEELAGDDDTAPLPPSYGVLEITGTKITDEDGNEATAKRISVSIDEMDGDLPTASTFSVEELILDTDTLDDDGKKALTDLGYETLNLSVKGQGRWDPDAATVDVSNLEISGVDAATFRLSFQLGGVTREVIEKLDDAQGNPEQALSLLQGVSVGAITLHLDNDSLVERALDMQAKEAGTDRAGMVAQLEAGLPLMLGILQNPAFQKEVSTSVTTFLKAPDTLTVKAAPAAPVPVAQLMGTVMLAPQTLPQVLGVSISANGAE